MVYFSIVVHALARLVDRIGDLGFQDQKVNFLL